MKTWWLGITIISFLLPGENAVAFARELEIVMVAKHEGITWFDDMRTGLEEFGKTYGVNAYQIAPEGGALEKQIQMVEELIAKGVDAICVVPNDPLAMKPVLRKARQAGIVVVSHEAQQLADVVDYDLEAFANEDFGRLMMESLAEAMRYKGQYAGFVGALTMETHMQWFHAGVALQQEKYPRMELMTPLPIEDKNDENIAYSAVLQVLESYKELRGILGCSVSSTTMSALAVEKQHLKHIAVVGLGLPSVDSPYLQSGYLKKAHCWRPADAGYVSALIAYKVLKGEKLRTGVNLTKSGYENCTVVGNIVFGNAPLVLTADNVDNYLF